MKFPLFADLDRDQRAVFSESPKNGGVLIVGPPGSGKTVLAMHRACRLAKSGKVTIGMFTKTLRQYTSNFEDLPENATVVHLHDWAKKWYKTGFNKDTYPFIGNKKYDIDWDQIDKDITNASEAEKRRLHWGHLIIDEGQDFSRKMYSALTKFMFSQDDPTLTLSVFADDNQTIFDNNSTISELKTELNASPRNKRFWRVDKNYRNTKDVAKFARHFQVKDSGTLTLPDREGMKPIIFVNKDLNSQIQHIANYCGIQTDKEIGVIVPGNSADVRNTYNAIKSILGSTDSKYTVQTYISKKSYGLNKWENLQFDKPPSITIIHQASSKGLEFDVVFVINLEGLYMSTGNEIDGFKKLYVVSSRPRDHLYYMVEGSPERGGFKDVMRLFPNPNDKEELCSYKSIDKDLIPVLGDMLNEVDWLDNAQKHKRNMYGDISSKLSKLNISQIKKIITDSIQGQWDYSHIPQLFNDRVENNNNIEESILDTLVDLSNTSIRHIKEKVS